MAASLHPLTNYRNATFAACYNKTVINVASAYLEEIIDFRISYAQDEK